MNNTYDYIFITTQPAFYKINLYNEINKEKKILVIFIAEKSTFRKKDFSYGEKKFDYVYLTKDFYDKRNYFRTSFKLVKILNKMNYNKIILGGWDSLENWLAWIITRKEKNALVVESSEFESKCTGIKGLLKKIFIRRISISFASGESQKKLLKNIGYNKKIIKTKGVGLFNYPDKKIILKNNINIINQFLYVGRLSPEKNIEQLIEVFNEFPELNLNIAGYGPLEKKLKLMANNNIKFLGKIDNNEINKLYRENHVFVLTSRSEAWGLVVEEALSNGLPVILSNRVGCVPEILKNEDYGIVYDINKTQELKKSILKIKNIENYLNYKKNIDRIDFKKIKESQVRCYLDI